MDNIRKPFPHLQQLTGNMPLSDPPLNITEEASINPATNKNLDVFCVFVKKLSVVPGHRGVLDFPLKSIFSPTTCRTLSVNDQTLLTSQMYHDLKYVA